MSKSFSDPNQANHGSSPAARIVFWRWLASLRASQLVQLFALAGTVLAGVAAAISQGQTIWQAVEPLFHDDQSLEAVDIRLLQVDAKTYVDLWHDHILSYGYSEDRVVIFKVRLTNAAEQLDDRSRRAWRDLAIEVPAPNHSNSRSIALSAVAPICNGVENWTWPQDACEIPEGWTAFVYIDSSKAISDRVIFNLGPFRLNASLPPPKWARLGQLSNHPSNRQVALYEIKLNLGQRRAPIIETARLLPSVNPQLAILDVVIRNASQEDAFLNVLSIKANGPRIPATHGCLNDSSSHEVRFIAKPDQPQRIGVISRISDIFVIGNVSFKDMCNDGSRFAATIPISGRVAANSTQRLTIKLENFAILAESLFGTTIYEERFDPEMLWRWPLRISFLEQPRSQFRNDEIVAAWPKNLVVAGSGLAPDTPTVIRPEPERTPTMQWHFEGQIPPNSPDDPDDR